MTLGAVTSENPVDALIVAVGHAEYRDLLPVALIPLCRSDKPVLADDKALYNRHAATETDFTVFRL